MERVEFYDAAPWGTADKQWQSTKCLTVRRPTFAIGLRPNTGAAVAGKGPV